MFDLVIVGGGPAGISAGIYSSRQKVKTLLISKDFQGQIGKKPVGVENYLGFPKISGMELASNFEKHLKENEVEIIQDEVEKVEEREGGFLIKTSSGKGFSSKTIIIATGANPKKLNIKGEEDFIGKGVSYCALCDGFLFKNDTVAVIGGGNAGFETAMYLKDIAKKIYIIEYADSVRAEELIQERVASVENIEVIVSAKLKEIQGNGTVKSIVCENLKTGEEKEIEVKGVFIQAGYVPAVSMVENLVDLNEGREIVVNPLTFETNIKGLFAVGDVCDSKYKQLIIAAGSGAIAALSAYNLIK